LDLMAAVFISSLLRARITPRVWRGIHWLAYGCWPLALAHTFGIGTDGGEGWVIALGSACIVSVLAALLWRLRSTAKRAATLSSVNAETTLATRLLVSSAKGSHREQ
jgi:DMSO/TMAO reductase YedYZ heme-binding membrane subunit